MAGLRKPRTRRTRGGSVVELALLLPWLIFLFVGAFDCGFFFHALVSTASAARVVALYTSADSSHTSSTGANDTATCTLALEELRVVANVGSNVTTCTALPVIVTYSSVTGADGQPASSVTVQYQTLRLIPIPGLLSSQFTFTQTVQMRLRA